MTTSAKTICVVCNKPMRTYICDGCTQRFCYKHLDEHRKELERELDQIETNHDELRQMINEHKQDPRKHPIINEINQWEIDSIDKIKQTANQCREKFINYTSSFFQGLEDKLNHLAQEMKGMRQENEFNDLDLYQLQKKLNRLKRELLQPKNIFIEQQPTSLINCISLRTLSDSRWKQLATTIAGENGHGTRLDQFNRPVNICLNDQDRTIYIVDLDNHRIVEWQLNGKIGRIVAGGHGQGNRLDQLNNPTDVIIDRQNNTLIIVDRGNRRVMRWSRHSDSPAEILISDIDCARLAMHRDGTLYVSDWKQNEVKRWKKGETCGTVVAGGNGQGNQLNQLHFPTNIFIDHDHTLYVSDFDNHRVMKWAKDAKEGIVIAGGNGQGSRATQLSFPHGVTVDRFGNIFVVDHGNNRVMRWREGEKEGRLVVGGNGKGQKANQFDRPMGLSMDNDGNLYVVDCMNNRIQKFDRDRN